jgi:hypothetical protein
LFLLLADIVWPLHAINHCAAFVVKTVLLIHVYFSDFVGFVRLLDDSDVVKIEAILQGALQSMLLT